MHIHGVEYTLIAPKLICDPFSIKVKHPEVIRTDIAIYKFKPIIIGNFSWTFSFVVTDGVKSSSKNGMNSYLVS